MAEVRGSIKKISANCLEHSEICCTFVVIISSIFEGIENRSYLLFTGIAVVGASLGWGLLLIQDDDDLKKKKGR